MLTGMADPLANQNALFNQYESEYCSKSTDISRKVQALSSFSAGETNAVFVKLSICSGPFKIRQIAGVQMSND